MHLIITQYRKLNLTNFLVSNAKKIGFTVEKFLILINEPYIFNQNICHTRLLISSTTRTCSILKILKKFKIYRDNFCPFPFLYLLHTFVSHSSKLLILDGKEFQFQFSAIPQIFNCFLFWNYSAIRAMKWRTILSNVILIGNPILRWLSEIKVYTFLFQSSGLW